MTKFRVCVSKPHHRSRGTVLYWYGTVSLGGLEVWDNRQRGGRRGEICRNAPLGYLIHGFSHTLEGHARWHGEEGARGFGIFYISIKHRFLVEREVLLHFPPP